MFDTEMDIYLPPSNGQAQSQRPTVEAESAFSSGWGPCFPVSRPLAGTPTPPSHLAPPDEPHAKLEHQGMLWSMIPPKYSHLWCFSVGELLDLNHEKKSGAVCKHAPSRHCSACFFHWGFFSWSSLSLEVFFHRAFDKETCQCMAKPIQYCKVK